MSNVGNRDVIDAMSHFRLTRNQSEISSPVTSGVGILVYKGSQLCVKVVFKHILVVKLFSYG